MSWNGDCPSRFRCLTPNRSPTWIVPEEEVCREIDYRSVRERFKFVHPTEWSPLVEAFLSDKNLSRLSKELTRRVNRATGQNVFIEMDTDENLYNVIIEIMHRNVGRDWTTDAVRCLNNVFLSQAEHDVVYGLRQRARNERLLNLKTGKNFLMERPLYRTLRARDIDMNPTYHSMSHPFAKAKGELEAYQKQQLYGEKPHGVMHFAPYYWG
jgi:hypothetical protein